MDASMSMGSRSGEHGYDGDEASPSSLAHYRAGTHDAERGIGSAATRGGGKRSTEEDLDRDVDREEGQASTSRRKKKAVSCEGCRRRKLKCDRGWPVSGVRVVMTRVKECSCMLYM